MSCPSTSICRIKLLALFTSRSHLRLLLVPDPLWPWRQNRCINFVSNLNLTAAEGGLWKLELEFIWYWNIYKRPKYWNISNINSWKIAAYDRYIVNGINYQIILFRTYIFFNIFVKLWLIILGKKTDMQPTWNSETKLHREIKVEPRRISLIGTSSFIPRI